MDNGWIINYTDGTAKIFHGNKAFAQQKNVGIESLEHWFDIKEAIEKHPYLEVIE